MGAKITTGSKGIHVFVYSCICYIDNMWQDMGAGVAFLWELQRSTTRASDSRTYEFLSVSHYDI